MRGHGIGARSAYARAGLHRRDAVSVVQRAEHRGRLIGHRQVLHRYALPLHACVHARDRKPTCGDPCVSAATPTVRVRVHTPRGSWASPFCNPLLGTAVAARQIPSRFRTFSGWLNLISFSRNFTPCGNVSSANVTTASGASSTGRSHQRQDFVDCIVTEQHCPTVRATVVSLNAPGLPTSPPRRGTNVTARNILARRGIPGLATSALGLHWDWTLPAASASGLGSPPPHLHRDWAHLDIGKYCGGVVRLTLLKLV